MKKKIVILTILLILIFNNFNILNAEAIENVDENFKIYTSKLEDCVAYDVNGTTAATWVYYQKIQKNNSNIYLQIIENFQIPKDMEKILEYINNYIKNNLKIYYGGSNSQIEDLSNKKTKCYGSALLTQSLLQKAGVESRILMLGHVKDREENRYNLLINRNNEKVRTFGHAMLLAYINDKIIVINTTNFLNYNYEIEQNSWIYNIGTDEDKILKETILKYFKKEKYIEEPDKINGLLLPKLEGSEVKFLEKNILNN